MVAQKLVQDGLRWQIGNGFKVQVWKDKWLPSSSTYKVVSPRLNSPLDLSVSELIDMENRCSLPKTRFGAAFWSCVF